MTSLPVLWICGPPGAGKTTIAGKIYSELARTGAPIGYADLDQLGICYPEPQSDPGRYRMAAQNLAAVLAGYRTAGAGAVVVSGVVDPAHGVHTDHLPDIALTVCRLRADPPELTRRLLARNGDSSAMVADALAQAETLDAGTIGDPCIDTSELSVDQVVRLVQQRTGGWAVPVARGRAADPATSGTAGGPILWLCGPTGVGKSTAGFDLYLRHVRGRQIPGAFVDLDQIGFYPPAPSIDHPMRAHILATMWQHYRAAGARCLTVVGPAENQTAITTYTRALPAATITVCRLHAGPGELTRRIMLRGQGGSRAQPGDPLQGQPAAHLASVAARAVADAAALELAGVGDLRIDTDRRTAQDVADTIIAGPAGRSADPATAPLG